MASVKREEAGIVTMPALPIKVAVEALRTVEEGLDKLLDSVYETDERKLADKIEQGITAAGQFIRSVADDIPEDDDAKEAYAKRCLEKLEHAEALAARENGDSSISIYRLDEGPKGQEVTSSELVEGLTFVRTMFRELGEELLSFNRDEVEEVADLALSVARIWLDVVHSMTRRTLGMLEKDLALEDEVTDHKYETRVEEATDAEIEEFYRAKGEEPPPRRAPQAASPGPPSAPSSSSSQGSKRRKRHAPARLLWHPVAPALAETVNNLPQTARQSPFKTCGTVMVLLPFSGLVIFLPGVLVTDHFLQKLYSAYGSSVEVVVDDGLQMARLGFVMAKLTVRQTYRVVRRQLVKVGADPQAAIKTAASVALDAAVHPLRTAGTVIETAKGAAKGAIDWVMWIKDLSDKAKA